MRVARTSHRITPLSLLVLVKPFLLICLLRAGPRDLPASAFLLGLALAASTVGSTLVAVFLLGPWRALLEGIAETLLLGLLTVSLLGVLRLQARIVQTLTALAGSGTLIGLLALPIYAWARGLGDAEVANPLPTLLLLALLAWSLVVSGHILRQAMAVPFFVGLMVSVMFYWISVTVLTALFPALV